MPGFHDDVMFANNVDFSGAALPTAQVTTNGQLLIGSTIAPNIRVATLTPGAGIAITNGAGSVTISTTGSGFTWNDVIASPQTLVVENGYVTDFGAGVTYILPATAVFGDAIAIVGKLGSWTVTQNANQQILIGSQSSTIGIAGSISSTGTGDCIQLICITGGANTVWRAVSTMGNITTV